MINFNAYKNIKKEAGFTLIELLLVVALMAIAVGVTGDVLITLVRSYNKSQILNEIEQNTNFVAQKMEKELRNAVKINSIGTNNNPTAGVSGNSVTFQSRANANEISYRVSGNVLERDDGTGTFEPLTSNALPMGVDVTCGADNCFKLLATSPQVIQMNIIFKQAGSAGGKVFEGEINLQDTIVIRDTY